MSPRKFFAELKRAHSGIIALDWSFRDREGFNATLTPEHIESRLQGYREAGLQGIKEPPFVLDRESQP